jgi:hypothetical protein
MKDTSVDFNEGSVEPAFQLELLVAYEDIPACERVKCAVDRVLSQSNVNASGRFNLYKLNELGNPEIRELAAKQAAQADILVLSMHGKNQIGPVAGDSLKQWVGLKRCKPCAAVISLDPEDKEQAGSYAWLTELCSTAAGSGMTVMMQFAGPPGFDTEFAIAEIRRRADTPFHLFDESMHGLDSHPNSDLRR